MSIVTVINHGASAHLVTVVGVPGLSSPVGVPNGALLVTNRLSELAADPATQEAAQANLGLGASDPLAYYILAKA